MGRDTATSAFHGQIGPLRTVRLSRSKAWDSKTTTLTLPDQAIDICHVHYLLYPLLTQSTHSTVLYLRLWEPPMSTYHGLTDHLFSNYLPTR